MLDAVLRRHAEPYTARLAVRLAALGVRSAALTLAGFLCAVGALFDIAHRHFWLGLALLAAGRVFDGLDGPLARREVATARGGYLDGVLSLVASAAIPFAFALAQPDHALAAMFLMLGLVARAAAQTAAARPSGLAGQALGVASQSIGKTELFVAFAFACLFPGWFSLIAYVLGILCFIGAGLQVAAVMVEPT